jgi:hypothetical protein
MPTPRLRLGQLLVDARMITSSALDEVLALQRADGRRLGTLLVERGLINETQLTQILSHQLSVPWVSLLHIEFSRQLLNLVPREVADRFCLVPIYVRHVRNQGDTLYVAMDDPTNDEGLQACREHAGLPARAMIAPPSDIRSAIRAYYGVDTSGASGPSSAAVNVGPKEEPATRREPSAIRAAARPGPPAPPAADPLPPAEAALLARSTAPTDPPAATPDVHGVSDLRETRGTAEAAAAPESAEPSRWGAPEPSRWGAAPPKPPAEASGSDAPEPSTKPEPATDMPHIETTEIEVDLSRIEHLREAAVPPEPPPSQAIPHPRGRAPRMVALTLLDGTTITLPAKRKPRPRLPPSEAGPESAPPATPEPRAASATSEPPPNDPLHHLTARDLAMALRVVANGADASEVLGEDLRWEALFSALLSLLLKKHIIADWEFVDELKKRV